MSRGCAPGRAVVRTVVSRGVGPLAKIRFSVTPQGLSKALELTERERDARGERRGRKPALTERQAPSPRWSSIVHS